MRVKRWANLKEKTWHPYSRLLEQPPCAGLPILSGICGHKEGGRGGASKEAELLPQLAVRERPLVGR